VGSGGWLLALALGGLGAAGKLGSAQRSLYRGEGKVDGMG
jgi:hypothetical protein